MDEESHRPNKESLFLYAISSWFRKCILIIYKHLLVRKYHYILTICELLLPILVMFFVALIGAFSKPEDMGELTYFPKEDPMRGQAGSRLAIFLIPNVTYTQDFIKYFQEQLRRTPGSSDRHMDFYVLKDEETYNKGEWPNVKPNVVIIFKALSSEATIPNIIDYELKLSEESLFELQSDLTSLQHVIALHFVHKIDKLDITNNVTMRLFPFAVYCTPKRIKEERMWFESYLKRPFFYIHIGVLIYLFCWLFIIVSVIGFTLQRFPQPQGYAHGIHLVEFSGIYFGVLVPIAFVLIIPALLTQVVLEKEYGIKELLRLTGLPRHIQWLGFTINSFVVMFLSSFVMVLMMTHKYFPYIDILFVKTGFLHLLLIFTLYILSSIAFCFFLSTLCTRATRATVFGFIVWILSFCIPIVVTDVIVVGGVKTSHQFLWALLPNMALFWSLRFIGFLEYTNGLEDRYYFESGTIAEDLCMFPLLLMFLLDIILYWCLAWYFDQLFPGRYGVPRPWYFLCKLSSWKCWRKRKKSDPEAELEADPQDKHHNNIFHRAFEAYVDPLLYKMNVKTIPLRKSSLRAKPTDFEDEPDHLEKVVAAEKLQKVFKKLFSQPVVAVQEVNLNIYQGEIFVLLGENGAGKTVTMSILAGVFAPTSGTAYINGYDIRTQLSQAREDIGFCPQGDTVFWDLTIKQHFKFFGRLKGLRGSILTGEVNFLLQRLKLWEHRKKRIKQLPGGMKRRLQLGIAVIGHVQLIILDEPTSGMDPEARQLVWDLLREKRSKCCILISTHYVEEADALADRIAIMSHGKILCAGSPSFLRAHFGADYVMKVTKAVGCDSSQILQLIQRHMPEAYIDTETKIEVIFVLPESQKTHFPDLFRDIEARLEQMNISTFGLSTMGMDNVFLKVTETAEKKAAKIKTPPNQPGPSRQTSSAAPNFITTETYIEPLGGTKRFLQRFRGLIMKKVYYTHNRQYFFFCQVVYIISVTILAVLILKKKERDIIATNWDESIFPPGKPLVIFELHDTTKFCLPDSFVNNFPEEVTVRSFPPDVDISEQLIEVAKEDPIGYKNMNYIMAASFITRTNNQISANAMYYMSSSRPEQGILTKLAALNLVHNALLQNCHRDERKIIFNVNLSKILTPNEEATFPVDGPMPSTIAYRWAAAIFLAIGFSLMVSCFIVMVAHERITESKHMQIMTGTSSSLYWTTTFIFDYLFYLFCCIMCIITIAIFDGSILNLSYVSRVMFLTMLLFGWSAIPFAYLMSYWTKSPVRAYVTIIIIHLLSILVGAVLQTVWLQYDYGDFHESLDCLYVVFELLPACSFVSILLKLWTTARASKELPDFEPLILDNKGVGRQLLVLTITGPLYMLIVLVMEIRNFKCIRFTVALLTRTLTDTAPPFMEPNVDAEDRRVKDLLYHHYRGTNAVRSTATMSEGDDLLLVDNLTKRFTHKSTAVDHLTFGVRGDECFGLLGVKGAGKTTTFQMLTGSVLISIGNAFIYDKSIKDDRFEFLSQIGYCPQRDALIDQLTAREMLMLFGRLRGIKEDEVGHLADAYLTKIGLKNYAYVTTAHYSLGAKRKLSLALAFLGSPAVVLLDEPTAGVDPLSRKRMWEVISSCKTKGTAIVLSSNSMSECEVLCSRVAILKSGQFKCIGSVQYLKAKFGKGFKVTIKPAKGQDVIEQIHNHADIINFMEETFENCTIQSEMEGLIEYSVPYTSADWSKIFTSLEEAKQKFKWEEYFVRQTTLKQVFLEFASAKEEKEVSMISEVSQIFL